MTFFNRNRLKKLLITALGVFGFLGALELLVYFESHSPDSSIHSLADGLWFSLVTLTTVGYGDMYPVTPIGKIIGSAYILLSVGLIGFLIGNISSRINRYMENKKLGHMGTNFDNHIIIIGWDDFARQVTNQIFHSSQNVAIVTDNRNDIELIKDLYPGNKVFTLFADYHNLEALDKVNIKQAASVFINLPDDTEVLVYMLNIKKAFGEVPIVVSLENPNLKDTFKAAGVTYMISKTEIASKLVASFIFEPDVAHLTEDIMSTAIEGEEENFDLQQYLVTEENPYVGKNGLEVFMDLKTSHDTVFMAISRGKKLIKNPSKEMIIQAGDYLIVMANGFTKASLEKTFQVTEGKGVATCL